MAATRAYKVDEASRPAMDQQIARMFGQRNAAFAAQLAPLLQRGPGVFAAFGAGHLIGSDGVIARLRALGWRVEPVMLE